MANEVTALDPFGLEVVLSSEKFTTGNETGEIYDDVTTVIQKPAMVIEVRENNETRLYYLRSVGGNNTLLIAVHLNNGRWEAYEYLRNPSSKIVSEALKKGKQIF